MNTKYGCWIVGDKLFEKKAEALVYASKVNLSPKYYYYNNVWKNLDRTLLGKIPLEQLYKERAQQLRDKYDYLILYFSGGADSTNILMTYLNNNIKIDEVRVKWPKALRDGKHYTPNTQDRTIFNIWSEWDFVIKPFLDKLSVSHPEINITFVDQTETLTTKNVERAFETTNHARGGLLLNFGNSVITSKSSKVGHIFGFDKPTIALDDNNVVHMFFSDVTLNLLYSDAGYDPESKECFYWSPDMPILPMEMAYQVSQYYNVNKDKRRFLYTLVNGEVTEQNHQFLKLKVQVQNNITKSVCYPNWDKNTFQAEKVTSITAYDKWHWFFYNPEYQDVVDAFYSMARNITQGIDSNYIVGPTNSPVFKVLNTEMFPIITLKD